MPVPSEDRRDNRKQKYAQPDLAALLLVSPQTVISWEKTGLPRAFEIALICRTFNVSADWLLGLSDEGGPAAVADPPALPNDPAGLRRLGDRAVEVRDATRHKRDRRAGDGQA
jgi:DNA-binding XRE family transcriptional regulator